MFRSSGTTAERHPGSDLPLPSDFLPYGGTGYRPSDCATDRFFQTRRHCPVALASQLPLHSRAVSSFSRYRPQLGMSWSGCLALKRESPKEITLFFEAVSTRLAAPTTRRRPGDAADITSTVEASLRPRRSRACLSRVPSAPVSGIGTHGRSCFLDRTRSRSLEAARTHAQRK
jgi:hypothetical protein